MADEVWEFPDAWLMMAIADCGPDTSLGQLIVAADVRNHAIPSRSEIEQSVGRLSASGLATVDGTTVSLTPDGLALAGRARGGLFTQAEHLLRLLARHPIRVLDRFTRRGWLNRRTRG